MNQTGKVDEFKKSKKMLLKLNDEKSWKKDYRFEQKSKNTEKSKWFKMSWNEKIKIK